MRPVPCLYHYRLSSSSIYHANVVAIDHRHAQICRSNVSGVVHICSLLVHVAACSIYFWIVLPLLSSTNNRFNPSKDPVLLCSLLTAKHTLDYTCSLPTRPFCVRYSYCAVPPSLLYTPPMRSLHPIVVFWSSPFPLSSVRHFPPCPLSFISLRSPGSTHDSQFCSYAMATTDVAANGCVGVA
jgi:hypothetical protein